MRISNHPWRRVGAVLECRLDVRFALRRSVRTASDEAPAPQRLTAEEALRLFGQPDLPAIAAEVLPTPWSAD